MRMIDFILRINTFEKLLDFGETIYRTAEG